MIFAKKIILSLLIFIFLLADSLLYRPSFVMAEEDAGDIKDKLEKYEDKKEETQQELNNAQIQLQRNKNQINLTTSLIDKTEEDIYRKEKEVEDLRKKMELNHIMLEAYLQKMYYENEDSLGLSFLLDEEDMSQATEEANQAIGIKEKILGVINEINEDKADIENAKAELSEKKEDHEKLLSIHQGAQYEIKEDIQQAQASLSELNAKIDKLRGELSKLLGSSVSFKNIMDAASFAAKVTGIRKDYLLGVLVVESNLGRYTGGCDFKQSRMSGTRAEIFQDICKGLKYDYKKMKVSCPPSGYKGTGGAMGVAQFMPDTWIGYKSSIASVTGHNPPDPWDLTDGVVAMALKLTKVDGVKQHKESAEAKAYCVYLAGGNWAAYCDSKGVNYGQKVLYWADNYEKVMK